MLHATQTQDRRWDVYFKQPQHQYLEQSLLVYWVHTLSRVLSVNPAPAVSLHSVSMTAVYRVELQTKVREDFTRAFSQILLRCESTSSCFQPLSL